MAQTPLAEAGRLLAVFAHPDDEAFGAGGTLAKYASAGAHVTLLTMTRGEAGMSGDLPLSGPAEVGAQRAQELRCSCQVLGIQRLCLLGYPDGELAAQRPDEVVAHIVRTMREMRPHVVIAFGPDGVTGHPDHIAISRLTTEAFHRSGDASQHPRNDMRAYRPERLFYVATPASVAKQRGMDDLQTVPDERLGAVIDVADHTPEKLQALRCHRSQRADVERMLTAWGGKLAPQESFKLAAPTMDFDTPYRDLFQGLSVKLPHNNK